LKVQKHSLTEVVDIILKVEKEDIQPVQEKLEAAGFKLVHELAFMRGSGDKMMKYVFVKIRDDLTQVVL